MEMSPKATVSKSNKTFSNLSHEVCSRAERRMIIMHVRPKTCLHFSLSELILKQQSGVHHLTMTHPLGTCDVLYTENF